MAYGLPYTHKGKILSDAHVRELFQGDGGVVVTRAVPVEREKGEDDDWESSNNSWALISFNRQVRQRPRPFKPALSAVAWTSLCQRDACERRSHAPAPMATF